VGDKENKLSVYPDPAFCLTIVTVRDVAQSDAVSCSCVKIGWKLLGFAVAKSLFPPLQ